MKYTYKLTSPQVCMILCCLYDRERTGEYSGRRDLHDARLQTLIRMFEDDHTTEVSLPAKNAVSPPAVAPHSVPEPQPKGEV